MTIEKLYQLFLEKKQNITTDSRNITPNTIFFALKGENFNGNKFAKQAINNGAAYAVIDEKEYGENNHYILVNNVLKTLQDLAKYHRKQLKIPVFGITGTNGKTTTKELIAGVLSKKYKTTYTKGNLNNHIGVPLTILSITNETEVAVIEMGANHPKEIEFLCNIASPTEGLITNIGKAHLEGFGSFENIIKTKNELYNSIKNTNGIIFYNKTNNILSELINEYKNIYSYGNSLKTNYYGKILTSTPTLMIEWRNMNKCSKGNLIKTQITGEYNFENILAATAVGSYFNVSDTDINKAVSEYIPKNNRSQIEKTQCNTLLLDAYNANPESMSQALQNFEKYQSKNKKTIILGDMLELGNYSAEEHLNIVNMIETLGFESVYLVGKEFTDCIKQKSKPYLCFNNTAELKQYLTENFIKQHTILIKGSRGIGLEKIIDVL